MQLSAVSDVETAQRARAVSVQTMAFVADPIMRWLWPDAHDYVTHFPTFVHGFGGRAFENDSAHASEEFLGTALWLPPEVHPDDDAIEALFKETLAEPCRSEIFSILEQMDQSHPKQEHWHLAFIGVDAAHQGKGVGAAVLRYGLEKIDQQGLHAYLESSNPANIPFYQRHGFDVIREIQVGNSPAVYPMLRTPAGG